MQGVRRREPRLMGDAPELRLPVRAGRRGGQLVEDEFSDSIQDRRPVRCVAVQAHRVPAQLLPKPAHRQRLQPLGVNQIQRGGEYEFTAQPGLVAGLPCGDICEVLRGRH